MSTRRVRPLRRPSPPNYAARRPQYEAFRELNFLLGMQDTFVNLCEVAIRFFESEMDVSEDPRAFVNRACRDLKVNTSLGVEWGEVRRNTHRFAVVQAMSVIDSFIRELTREYRFYRGILTASWKSQADGKDLDPLAALAENLPKVQGQRLRRAPEYDIIAYYRAVRNRAAHQTVSDTDVKLERLIDQHAHALQASYGSQPKAYDDIDYGDFLLLTRVAKNYAKLLNDACDLQPSDLAARQLEDPEFLSRIRLDKTNRRGLLRRLAPVAGEFALDADDTATFFQVIEDFLAKDPPKKARRRLKEAK